MMILFCKKCGSKYYVKAGFIKGEQRYMCKECGCKYVPTRTRGKPEKDKLLAVWLYSHGLSFRTVAKLFKVSVKSIFDWVKIYGKTNKVKPEPSDAVVVELDEIWRYLTSQKDMDGYGNLIAVIPINLSTGNAESAAMLHFQDFSNENIS